MGARPGLLLGFVGLLAVLFVHPLFSLAIHAAGTDINSHILLVPFIVAYLLYIQRDRRLPARHASSLGWAVIPLTAGCAALIVGWALHPISQNDFLALMAFSFVCFVTAGGFLFLGREWMAAAAFPVAFLFFLVPLPDLAVDWLETASQLASAEAAHLLFVLFGTPVLRDGNVFQLPGMIIEVAQECSGIRSSWVLLITSLLAAFVFLKSPWRRVTLLVMAIVLGVLRNGVRILVIGLLCVSEGPHMLRSSIHTRGGPVFFAMSLVVLLVILWWLRKGEARSRVAEGRSELPSEAA